MVLDSSVLNRQNCILIKSKYNYTLVCNSISMNNQLPVSTVSYGRPTNHRLSNMSLKNGLEGNLIPAIVNDLQIVAVRCIFNFLDYGEAVKQIAARRRLLEKKLLECEEVIVSHLFSYYHS